ncbi:BON domain-containing protein [Serpentinimonas barnesii]|uniref:BON domain-containing protein n=1 Tax=Serpentinimonas barnesii TaxID=1458427 RepID=UPI0004967D4B|nr:BON domain-containing protein [Serpentinimonas barnesii]
MFIRKFSGHGRLVALAALVLAASVGLPACAPLIAGGAVATTVLVATDRRTSGAMVEDQGIEMRAANRLRTEFGNRGRVNVTSYNRRVLITGEVPSETDRALALRIVGAVENVQGVVDELAVTGTPSLTARAADRLVSARVRAGLIDAPDLSSNAFLIVTERGTVYLLGRVTPREADRATEIARRTAGVQRVVRVLETITEEELARIAPPPAPASAAPRPSNN